MKKFGIDISKWQGDFPLGQAVLTEGVEFVIIKCGGSDKGVYTDNRFESNYRKAKECGIHVGAYWFSKAMNTDEAKRDALYMINLLNGKTFDLPIYIDVENKYQLAIGKNKLTSVIDVFLSTLEEFGYYAGIYSSESYFKTYMDDNYLKKYAHWIAKWSTKQPAGAGVWQFGGETNKIRSNKICGMTVDQDFLLVDYPAVIKSKGFNGYIAESAQQVADNTVHDALTTLLSMGYTVDTIRAELDKLC